jgi:hypothetical protein
MFRMSLLLAVLFAGASFAQDAPQQPGAGPQQKPDAVPQVDRPDPKPLASDRRCSIPLVNFYPKVTPFMPTFKAGADRSAVRVLPMPAPPCDAAEPRGVPLSRRRDTEKQPEAKD